MMLSEIVWFYVQIIVYSGAALILLFLAMSMINDVRELFNAFSNK